MTSQEWLWSVVNYFGVWWWWGQALLAARALYFMYGLAPAGTLYGRFLRISMWIGLGLMAASPFNNAFGPYAYYVILATVGGIFKQMRDQCRAAGKVVEPGSIPPIERMAAMMVVKP